MKNNLTRQPVRTSAGFRTMQATIILLAIEGKELALVNDDKMWRCLCNALLWALDGVITSNFVFDLQHSKVITAIINKPKGFIDPVRDEWLLRVRGVLDQTAKQLGKMGGVGDPDSPNARAEKICYSLVALLLQSFIKGTYAGRVNALFNEAQRQLTQDPIVGAPTNIAALAAVPLPAEFADISSEFEKINTEMSGATVK